MTIIDAHVHLWHPDNSRYSSGLWLNSSLPPQDGTAERLVRLMDEAGVAAALNVQVPWYGEDNRYHRDVSDRFPSRFALLGVIDPALADAATRLERMVREQRAQGLRIHFNEPARREQVIQGDCDAVLAMAGELGVTVQCLARMPDIPAIRRAAEAFPATAFVVDHLAHPDLSEAPPFPGAAQLFALGKLPNVYVKVSLLCDHSRQSYPYPDVQMFVRRMLEHFGPRRLMWGSNFPLIPEVRTQEPVDYRRSLELVRSDWPWMTDEDRDWILGKTALSLWSWEGEG
jgi:predicted TIM-barrel fold metal-dependent hydrolase